MRRELIFLTATTLTACAGYQQVPPEGVPETTSATTYEDARLQVEQDLEALASLELFEVGDMVVTADMMPGTCYGPCADDRQREQAYVDQAARLHGLVATAEDLSGAENNEDVSEALEALDALDIVVVGELIVTEPQSTGNCYGPCPDEQEEAEEVNADREDLICELASRTAGL